ncbi:aspartate aminotransferase [Photobacterium kishitanii]|uniref:aminotransferase class V-fold PLP-dependent enzyme n=1 Tax=Photobacterium kishitanii TaxID=318456 RepID=UPI000D1617BD|nr:aminotransferase class V-fold PLP-dependent enzyme [Photobacterium kishitanii]PSU85481.1 aspartate aminotransferase [Photobacterium kishitanii]
MNNDIMSFAFPGNIEDDILNIGHNQIPYMRTSEFSELYSRLSDNLTKLIDCDNGKTIIYTMSGTAAMECAVKTYGSLFDSIAIVNGGSFGERWKDICNYNKIDYIEYMVDFGKDIDYTDFEIFLSTSNINCLLIQHHETSSGQIYNLEIIGAICKKFNIFLIVDTISGFLSDHISMNDFFIDVSIYSSQKGLNIPPGLSFLTLSNKAQELELNPSCFYMDINNYLLNLKRGQTPFSPATQLFIQADKKVEKIKKIGLNKYIYQTKNKSDYFKQLCVKNDWKTIPEYSSNSVTAFITKIPAKIISEELLKEQIYVMPSSHEFLLRVTHTGIQDCNELEKLSTLIKKVEDNYEKK